MREQDVFNLQWSTGLEILKLQSAGEGLQSLYSAPESYKTMNEWWNGI